MNYATDCDDGVNILQVKDRICLILVRLIKTAHSQSSVVVV